MARPKKAPDERGTEQVNIRLSPREIATLRTKAEQADATVTAFVRAAALGKRVTVQQSTAPDFAMRDELRRIGVNLNQIAKAMNARRDPPPASLVSVCEKLDALFDHWLNHDPQSRPSRPQL